MKNTVVVFARVPRLGTVKRRLARDIGNRAALRFHVATLMGLLRSLRADRTFRTVLAVTPDRTHAGLPWPTECAPQGFGDIGQRMNHACRRFPRGNVLIVGCDIPAANASDARSAFKALGRADAVFGPAEDGGYWLVGMGPRRPARPFANARWSSEHALADTLDNFAGRKIARIRTLSDVDTAADYAALIRRALLKPPTSPAPAHSSGDPANRR